MAKSTVPFNELLPWYEATNRFQSQIDSLLLPFSGLQSDYAALTKPLSSVLDPLAIHDINRILSTFDSQSMTAIWHTQDLVSKIDMPGMASALRQFQTAIGTVAPMGLQVQIGGQLQEFSHIISNSIPDHIKPLTEARVAELNRLTSLAKEYTIGKAAEEPPILSEDDQRIVVAEVEDVLLSGKNWEQCFAEKIKNFSQTHPVIAWVLEKIFLAILLGIITNMVSPAIGQALFPANVYEEPRSSSPIVCRIELNQNVVVVGDVPYFYEVEIQNESAEHRYIGYVSKRSISLMESERESTGLE